MCQLLHPTPAMWRYILVTVVLRAHGALGHFQAEEDQFHATVEQLRTLAKTWDAQDRGIHGLAVAGPAVGSVARRRLLEVREKGVADMCSMATSWIRNTTGEVLGNAEKLLGIDKVIELFQKATTWVEKGVQVAKIAWEAMMKVEGKMKTIFDHFKPLVPIFGNSTGMIPLITSKTNMGILIHVVLELLNTTSDLKTLSSAGNSVSKMFREMRDLFKGALGKVDDEVKRRLSVQDDPKARALSKAATDYTELLQNLNFKKLAEQLFGFKESMDRHWNNLEEANQILGPLLEKLEAVVDAPAGRRLSGLSNVHIDQIIADQEKYTRAIKAIVPTWQGIEKTGIAMCPVVAESNGTSGSLKCRVAGFIQKGAMSTFGSMLSGLVGDCTEANSTVTGCPTQSLSANVSDLLGKNAAYMGWIIAISVAVLGALGFGATTVKKMASGSGEDSSDDEDSDEEAENQPLQ
mmetsp:Transcript_46487/g.92338  ORF Transcript_46487/g.92338 Transcript_46487/m.92338 type:complete len:463 (+) Transcript_46487:3-1391(+)